MFPDDHAGLSTTAIISLSVVGGAVGVTGLILLLLFIITPEVFAAAAVAGKKNNKKEEKSSAAKPGADDKLQKEKAHQEDKVDGRKVSTATPGHVESIRSAEEAMSSYYQNFGTPEDALSSFFDTMAA